MGWNTSDLLDVMLSLTALLNLLEYLLFLPSQVFSSTLLTKSVEAGRGRRCWVCIKLTLFPLLPQGACQEEHRAGAGPSFSYKEVRDLAAVVLLRSVTCV